MPLCSRPPGPVSSRVAIVATMIAAMTTAAAIQVSSARAQDAAAAQSQGSAPPRATRPAVVIAKVNLRHEPGTDSEIVTTIPAGSQVRIVECKGEWCAVTWKEHRGFAIARNLNIGGSRQAGVYPGQPGAPAYPVEGDLPGYEYYYGPEVVYGPAYYGPRFFFFGRFGGGFHRFGGFHRHRW